MITKDKALNLYYGQELHFTGKHECKKTIGPRGGIEINITRVRTSGKCKTWKRNPEKFHIPVKYGLYESYWIDESNNENFHLASECPLNEV